MLQEIRFLMCRLIVAVVVLAIAHGPCAWSQTELQVQPPAALASSDWRGAIDRFRAALRDDVLHDDVGGITAAVVYGDRMVWAEGFGWADRDAQIPAGVETIYRIGSLSKPIAAVALVQLAQAGRLDLDDPITQWVPEAAQYLNPEGYADTITLRHLVTHTSGLGREPGLFGHSVGPIAEWESKVLAAIPTARRDRAPGEAVAYSNIGFATLGLAIGRAAGEPYIEWVEREVFARLKMHQSGFRIPEPFGHWMSTGYLNRRLEDGDGWRLDADTPRREHRGRGYRVPNGGVYSTVADLTRFVAAMSGVQGDVLLEKRWRDEMLRLQTPGDESAGYGLGFHIQQHGDGSRTAGHGGSVSGYTAYFAFDPDARVGVILLRNYNIGRTNLSRAANGALRDLLRATTAPTDGESGKD